MVAAALLNILGVFLTAPLFSALAGSEAAPFDLAALQKVALILLLPFVLGQLAQGRFGHIVREHRMAATWMDRTAIAIAVYVAFSGAVEEGLWGRVDLAEWAALLAGVAGRSPWARRSPRCFSHPAPRASCCCRCWSTTCCSWCYRRRSLVG